MNPFDNHPTEIPLSDPGSLIRRLPLLMGSALNPGDFVIVVDKAKYLIGATLVHPHEVDFYVSHWTSVEQELRSLGEGLILVAYGNPSTARNLAFLLQAGGPAMQDVVLCRDGRWWSWGPRIEAVAALHPHRFRAHPVPDRILWLLGRYRPHRVFTGRIHHHRNQNATAGS